MSELVLQANIYPDHVEVSDPRGINKKKVSPTDFLAVLARSISGYDGVASTSQRTAFGTIFSSHTVNELFTAIYYPERVVEYTLISGGETTKHKIHFPNVVLEALLNKGTHANVRNYTMYATDLPPEMMASRYVKGLRVLTGTYPDPDVKQHVMHVPATNMYENGTMCLGNNSVPPNHDLADLSSLHSYYHILTSATGNTDLPFRGLKGDLRDHAENHRAMLTHYASLKSVPYNCFRSIHG